MEYRKLYYHVFLYYQEISRMQTIIWINDELIPAYIEGLAQDGSNSIANALELPQYCTKPSIIRQ